MREYIGYLLAALIAVCFIFYAALVTRFDWITFQSEYRTAQTQVFDVVGRFDNRLKGAEVLGQNITDRIQKMEIRLDQMEKRLDLLERRVASPPSVNAEGNP